MTPEINVAERKDAPGEWGVEIFDSDGDCLVTIFSGPLAEQRARKYADSQSLTPRTWNCIEDGQLVGAQITPAERREMLRLECLRMAMEEGILRDSDPIKRAEEIYQFATGNASAKTG